jgi:dTDP-4-dehydrorhamnose 3,5-epimerase
MQIRETTIPGCFEITPHLFMDERGSFVKTFHHDVFQQHGLETEWREEYYSVSRKGVLRGMHFQTPPSDHAKLVYCTAGRVLDAVLDLRIGSPTYHRHLLIELDAETARMLYLPKGVAHAFYTLSESATMMYKVSTVYAPTCDTGILWNSAGIPWPDSHPVVSKRDSTLPALSDIADDLFRYRSNTL